jgi:hypothetical protein
VSPSATARGQKHSTLAQPWSSRSSSSVARLHSSSSFPSSPSLSPPFVLPLHRLFHRLLGGLTLLPSSPYFGAGETRLHRDRRTGFSEGRGGEEKAGDHQQCHHYHWLLRFQWRDRGGASLPPPATSCISGSTYSWKDHILPVVCEHQQIRVDRVPPDSRPYSSHRGIEHPPQNGGCRCSPR